MGTGVAGAVLHAADFPNGGTEQASTSVPDLVAVKCTPATSRGLVEQHKSAVLAASGRTYGNIVGAFDTRLDATNFSSAYLTSLETCTDIVAGSFASDNLGIVSFRYELSGTTSNLHIEYVEVGNLVSIIIQLIPAGEQPDDASLHNVANNSADKMAAVAR